MRRDWIVLEEKLRGEVQSDCADIVSLVKCWRSFVRATRVAGWIVGGCLRDMYYGQRPNDIDIVLQVESLSNIGNDFCEYVKDIAEVCHCKLIPAQPPTRPTDVYRLILKWRINNVKTELGTDLSRAAKNMRDDAMQRDFSLNALYYDLQEGKLRDFSDHGVVTKDVADQHIRVLSCQPLHYLREKPASIIRGVGLYFRYPNASVSKNFLKAASEVMEVSNQPGRVVDKIPVDLYWVPTMAYNLAKLFKCGNATDIVLLLRQWQLESGIYYIAMAYLRQRNGSHIRAMRALLTAMDAIPKSIKPIRLSTYASRPCTRSSVRRSQTYSPASLRRSVSPLSSVSSFTSKKRQRPHWGQEQRSSSEHHSESWSYSSCRPDSFSSEAFTSRWSSLSSLHEQQSLTDYSSKSGSCSSLPTKSFQSVSIPPNWSSLSSLHQQQSSADSYTESRSCSSIRTDSFPSVPNWNSLEEQRGSSDSPSESRSSSLIRTHNFLSVPVSSSSIWNNSYAEELTSLSNETIHIPETSESFVRNENAAIISHRSFSRLHLDSFTFQNGRSSSRDEEIVKPRTSRQRFMKRSPSRVSTTPHARARMTRREVPREQSLSTDAASIRRRFRERPRFRQKNRTLKKRLKDS